MTGVITPDYYRHPKIVAAGKRSALAVALDVACICYCADELTDGEVDHRTIYTLVPASRRSVFRAILVLEKVKRLVIATESSWRVQGFLEHNPTREVALVRRRNAADRQRRSREKRADVSRRDKEFWQWVENDEAGGQ